MTKKSPEKMLAICNTIASGIMSYAAAARINDVHPDTFWYWIKRSQQDADPALFVEYLGELVPFARAINAARRIALHEARGRMEQKSILGYDEPVFFSGMPTWKPDPVTVGWSEDEREALGFPRDGYLRDDKGRVIQNTIHHEPPVALQLRVAEMAFPKEYRPGVNNSVDVTHTISGIQHPKPVSYNGGPPPVPPAPTPPRLQKLEVLNGPDEVQIPETEPDADAELDEILGPEPIPEAPHVIEERIIRDVPSEREKLPPATPTPVGFLDAPNREPRNALERELFEHLARAREKARKP